MTTNVFFFFVFFFCRVPYYIYITTPPRTLFQLLRPLQGTFRLAASYLERLTQRSPQRADPAGNLEATKLLVGLDAGTPKK